MKKKKKQTFILRPEDEERGILLWFNLIYAYYRELFLANLIAIGCLLPAAYVGLVFTSNVNLVFLLLFAVLMALAGPGLTLLCGTACRISLRRPVWLKEDFLSIWRQDLKKSLLLGGLVGLVWGIIYFAAYMVYLVEGGFGLPVLMLILLYVYLAGGFTFFSFQQLAMLDIPFGRVLLNGVLLIFAGKARSLAAILLPIILLALCRYFYGVGGLLVIGGLPALALMTSNLIFAPVFSKLFLEEKDSE